MSDRVARTRLALLLVAAALILPSPSRAQDTCDVTVTLDEAAPPAVAAYGLDYAVAGGQFVGTSFAPACTRLFTGTENTIHDDDGGLLSNFVAALAGVPATQPLISCVFALDGGFPCPAPSAFVVTAPVFPPLNGVEFEDLFPNLPVANVTVSVTARTPVCGDGFREGTETCDDGNLTDGDCCSSACVLDGAGSACDDGSVCTSGETCDGAGSCVPGSTVSCDDADPCTNDGCDPQVGCTSVGAPAPHTQCEWDHHGVLDVRDQADPVKDKLTWTRSSPRSTSAAAVGNPTVDTDYALCIYDEVGGVAGLAARLDIPAGSSWKALGSTRFQYKDPSGTTDGVRRVQVDGKASSLKLTVTAKGAGLPLPGPVAAERYFAEDQQVLVQLRNTAGGCWSVGFANASTNSATRYKARTK